MEATSIREYERLERYYWWFIGRRRVIESVLEKYFAGANLQILDWGCGPGGNFAFLRRFGSVLGVDASDEAIRACREKGITDVVKADTLAHFQSEKTYDLITNFDVLEHIPEDEEFLRGQRQLLKPNGYILVTVPAYRFLWSSLDEVLGHVRRYRKGELTDKFNRAGYKVVKASYFIFFLSPAFIAYRLLQKIFEKAAKPKSRELQDSVIEFPALINWFFTKLVFLEGVLLKSVNLPAGTSIIVLGQKRDG